MSLEKEIAHRNTVQSPSIGFVNPNFTSIDISHPNQMIMYCCLGMLVAFTISCTLYREVSASMALIKFVFVIAGRSLQSFKLKLLVLN